jgi:hypothetical protein
MRRLGEAGDDDDDNGDDEERRCAIVVRQGDYNFASDSEPLVVRRFFCSQGFRLYRTRRSLQCVRSKYDKYVLRVLVK